MANEDSIFDIYYDKYGISPITVEPGQKITLFCRATGTEPNHFVYCNGGEGYKSIA
jgi:hypothetical protein